MPPSRSDRSLLLLAGSAIAIAAVFVAGFMLVITRDGSNVPEGLVFIGYKESLRDNLEEEGPQYIPNPFGDDGFWLDLEDGKIVALALDPPGKKDCNVRYRDSLGGYFDCDAVILQPDQLNRYAVGGGPKDAPEDALFANLKQLSPAPNP